MGRLNSGALIEHLSGEMWRGPNARKRKVECARMGLAVGYRFFERLHVQRESLSLRSLCDAQELDEVK
jgi:hypothetical protein